MKQLSNQGLLSRLLQLSMGTWFHHLRRLMDREPWTWQDVDGYSHGCIDPWVQWERNPFLGGSVERWAHCGPVGLAIYEALCPGMRPSDCIQPSSAHRGWPLLCKRRVSTGSVFPGFECWDILVDYVTHRIHVCYIWWHRSHQYTPIMLAYIPYTDPMGTMLTLDLDGFVVFLPSFYELSMGFSSAKKETLPHLRGLSQRLSVA